MEKCIGKHCFVWLGVRVQFRQILYIGMYSSYFAKCFYYHTHLMYPWIYKGINWWKVHYSTNSNDLGRYLDCVWPYYNIKIDNV